MTKTKTKTKTIMTRAEWKKLSPKEQQIKVAKCDGRSSFLPDDNDKNKMVSYTANQGMPGRTIVPDYLNDLNAMHEAEKILDEKLRFKFEATLHSLNISHGLGISVWETIHATAAQRAEAFVLTIEEANSNS